MINDKAFNTMIKKLNKALPRKTFYVSWNSKAGYATNSIVINFRGLDSNAGNFTVSIYEKTLSLDGQLKDVDTYIFQIISEFITNTKVFNKEI